MSQQIELIKENISPFQASNIGVYDEDGNKVGNIPLGNLHKNFGKRLYRFGVLSDVHHAYNEDIDYYITQQESGMQAASDLSNALNYLENKEDVAFTCICGDLTVQQTEELAAFNAKYFYDYEPGFTNPSRLSDLDSFKYNVEQIHNTKPIFIARGNHDYSAISSAKPNELNERAECYNQRKPEEPSIEIKDFKDLWKYYTKPQNIPSNLEIITEDGKYDKFCVKNKDTNDLFVFFPCFNGVPNFYENENVDWLTQILSQNSDKRIFIFLHVFFHLEAGEGRYPHGDFESRYGIDWMEGYYSSNIHNRLLSLAQTYKNVVWFSGHSHLSWVLQGKGDYKCLFSNISRNKNGEKESSWNVHIPSNAYPRIPSTTNNKVINQPSNSEGCIVDVYENYIDIRGIRFKRDSSTTKYIAAEFPASSSLSEKYQAKTGSELIYPITLKFKAKLKFVKGTEIGELTEEDRINASNFIIDRTKDKYDINQKVENDGDFIKITFTNNSQRFWVHKNTMGIESTTGYIAGMSIDDGLEIKDGNSIDITDNIKAVYQEYSNSYVGFYENDSKYTLESSNDLKLHGPFELPSMNYQNLYVPKATYRLNTPLSN